MVEKFKRYKFLLNVASQMNYEDGIVFTENNIVNYLAELEEYICALITVTAIKNNDTHPATSAIPLTQLNTKDFTKKDIEASFPIALILLLCIGRSQYHKPVQRPSHRRGYSKWPLKRRRWLFLHREEDASLFPIESRGGRSETPWKRRRSSCCRIGRRCTANLIKIALIYRACF